MVAQRALFCALAAAALLGPALQPAPGAGENGAQALVGPAGISFEGRVGAELGMSLGGLGTSTFEIGRSGAVENLRLQNDWTQAIAPTPAGTFFAVHARKKNGPAAGRLLQLVAPEGLQPIAGLTYKGRFPFVEIAYRDPALPCQVTLEAFSPFVPHDAAASSLPVVFFTFRLRNPGPEPITASAAISWVNDIAAETQRSGWPATGNRSTVLAEEKGTAPFCAKHPPGRSGKRGLSPFLPAVLMDTQLPELAGSEYLLACLAADGVRYQAVADWWKGPPGRWLGPNVAGAEPQSLLAWRSFLDTGRLPPESHHDDGLGRYSRHRPVAAVCGEVDLRPGEEKEVRFALAWYFPYHWDRFATKARVLLGHQYAVRFPGGTRDVAAWAIPQRDRLRQRSTAWRSLLDQSSLPPNCRAMMSEVLYLLPRLSWWLADGTFVLYESINCPRVAPTVLGVYSAPVLGAFFPELLQSAQRTIAATQLPGGEIASTLGVGSVCQHEYRCFTAGDASIFPLVTYWAALWGGDARFAEEMYPAVKRTLQWGERELDADRDGVPDVHGIDQGWDTFPMYGAAAYITDQWIAALLAGEKLAERLADAPFAAWCRTVRGKASATAEEHLWNGAYYDLARDLRAGTRSDICFADQFTYGTVSSGLLDLGPVHPRERIEKALRRIWALNVKPCRFVCRMGSNADGSPADVSSHRKQKGGPSQSNSFTPVSTAPLAAAAIQHGMVDEGLALAEQTAEFIVQRSAGPWSGELLFDSQTGRCFYGLHYSDCLILWDVMYALLGANFDTAQRSLTLAPPRVPVKIPLFTKLYFGQVQFSVSGRTVELRLENSGPLPCTLRTLTIKIPDRPRLVRCRIEEGKAGAVGPVRSGQTVLSDLAIPAGGRLRLQWD